MLMNLQLQQPASIQKKETLNNQGSTIDSWDLESHVEGLGIWISGPYATKTWFDLLTPPLVW